MRKININMFLIRLFLILACMANYFLNNEIISFIIFIPAIILALHQTIIKPIFAIDVILFLSFDAMGLLPSLSFSNWTLNWEDLTIIYTFFVSLVSIRYRAKYKLDYLGITIIIFFIFRIIGSIRGVYIYHQNFLTGMLTLRNTYALLAYFPIISFINKGYFNKKDLLDEIYKFIKIISIVNMIQLLALYIGIDFTNYLYEIRWGYRLRASNLLQVVGIFYYLYKLLNKETKNGDLFYAMLFALEIVFINQSRVLILGVVLTIIMIILVNPNTKNKFILIIGCILASGLILCNATVRNVITESVLESQSNNSGSILYRKYEKEYFDQKLFGHELLGVGTPNMHSGEAANYSGMLKTIIYKGYYMNGLYLSDLGVYAIKYYWGIIGLIFYLLFTIMSLIKIFTKTYLKKQYTIYNFLVFSLLIFNIIISSTLCFYISQTVIYLIMFLLYQANKAMDKLELRNDE